MVTKINRVKRLPDMKTSTANAIWQADLTDDELKTFLAEKEGFFVVETIYVSTGETLVTGTELSGVL